MNTLATVRELQQRITQMQPIRLHEKTLPTRTELSPLLPEGALVQGGAIAVHGSLRLAFALLAGASQAGAWCGAIGLPTLGIEAAHQAGIALERFVMIPQPKDLSLRLAGTLSEVLSVTLLVAPAQPSSAEVERVHAKLRDNDAALIVIGTWPRTHSTLRVMGSSWTGLERGHGMLETQELAVRSEDRRGPLQHRIRFDADRIETLPASSHNPARRPIHRTEVVQV